MINEFRYVPDEVNQLKDSEIFDISYTHATSSTSRGGVEKTGKLMAPRIALIYDVVSFSGESLSSTYLFRAYHVSVSKYPHAIDNHNWHKYINHGMIIWTPKRSEELIIFWEEEKKKIKDKRYNLVDWNDPSRRRKMEIIIDGCIDLEKIRQEKYASLTDKERKEIQNPKPEIYVFNNELTRLVSGRKMFGKPIGQVPHPFAPAEISLNRYLIGMFTSLDIDKTKEWISKVVKRDVPVGSLDALATYEKMMNY